MGQKLQGNGLWESSRMILPEHKNQFVDQRERDRQALKKRPVLDETQLEEISERIRDSVEHHTELEFTVWGRLNPVLGVVSRVDVTARRVKVGGEWVKLDDVVKVERV